VSHSIVAHPDIIDVLTRMNSQQFNITKIRDLLLASTMKDKNISTVRLFVSKHLNEMVRQGYLTTTGTRRQKTFRKTALFEQIGSFPNKTLNDDIEVESDILIRSDEKPFITELENIKNRLNGELAISIAEMDEYRSIMTLFPQTEEKVSQLHQESTQYSATLTGQITAIAKTIQLLQAEMI
jgi:hypothetical protein